MTRSLWPPGDDEGRSSPRPAAALTNDTASRQEDGLTLHCSARAVSWWNAHLFVARWIEDVGAFPLIGSVEWQQLADDAPRKWAAILDAAQHWALRVETAQQAECQASHAISGAADWPAIASHIRDRRQFYAERPWLKRVAS